MTVAEPGGTLGPPHIEPKRHLEESLHDQAQRIDLIFKALADGTRRRILHLLHGSSHSVGDIVERFHLTQPSISRHLAILRSAGLVSYSRQGQKVIYRPGEPGSVELAMVFLSTLSGRRNTDRSSAGPGSGV